MRLRRLLSGRPFSCFLVMLVVLYVIVWLQVFRPGHTRSHNDSDSDEDDGDCKCRYSSQEKLKKAHHLEDLAPDYEYEEDPPKKNDIIRPRYEHIPTKAFSPDHEKKILILAYQRVGSSFFGKIFDLNADIFYVYEPLDSLYQSIYGTGSGFNVPSDIFSLRDGNDRLLPSYEVNAVTTFLEDLLSCRTEKLPTEFFVHSFWSFLAMFMPSWKPYLQCLNDTQLLHARDKCARPMNCPKRFGSKPRHIERCRKGLEDLNQKNFIGYKDCMSDVRTQAMRCMRMMEVKCTNSTFRAAKTVRGTMASVEKLIVNNPNLRVIHLLRGPRPVALSRMITVTYRGIYSKNSTISESQLYCNMLHRDLLLRRDLETKYPGVFFEVIYEDFVQYPEEYAKAVYKFLEMDIPESLLEWLHDKTRGQKQSDPKNKSKAPKWKRGLTVEEAESIVANCESVLKMIKYDFG